MVETVINKRCVWTESAWRAAVFNGLLSVLQHAVNYRLQPAANGARGQKVQLVRRTCVDPSQLIRDNEVIGRSAR